MKLRLRHKLVHLEDPKIVSLPMHLRWILQEYALFKINGTTHIYLNRIFEWLAGWSMCWTGLFKFWINFKIDKFSSCLFNHQYQLITVSLWVYADVFFGIFKQISVRWNIIVSVQKAEAWKWANPKSSVQCEFHGCENLYISCAIFCSFNVMFYPKNVDVVEIYPDFHLQGELYKLTQNHTWIAIYFRCLTPSWIHDFRSCPTLFGIKLNYFN